MHWAFTPTAAQYTQMQGLSLQVSDQVDLQVLLVQGGLQHILKGAHARGQVIAKLLSLELPSGLA